MIYNTNTIIIDKIKIKNRRVYTQYSKHISKGNYMTYYKVTPVNITKNIKLDILNA